MPAQMIALLIRDIPRNPRAAFPMKQDHVRLNHPPRPDGQVGANPAMMADTSTQNSHAYLFQLSPVERAQRYRQQIKVSERRASADERITPDNAALQAGIL